jgi:two-component system, NarL family, response regulator LiaR
MIIAIPSARGFIQTQHFCAIMKAIHGVKETSMSDPVFISYARKDGKEFAERLYDDLKANEVEVWLDRHDIQGGKEWNRELENAIETAGSFIVILTPAAVESIYVENEIIAAIDRGIAVIPLLALDCKVPLALKRLQYIDFRRDYQAAFRELFQVLQPKERHVDPLIVSEDEVRRRIRIMLVDDHSLVVKGLTVLLEDYEDFQIVGAASNGIQAIELSKQLEPDVILMDLVMPGMDGIAATKAICEMLPNVKIIITTSYVDADTVLLTTEAGAISFLLKNTSGDELAYAIRRTYANQSIVAPEVTQVLLDALHRIKTPPQVQGDNLTDHERDVLALMIDGLNNQEIADRLDINISTINSAVNNIFSKLGVTNRIQAIALAVEHKIIKRGFVP